MTNSKPTNQKEKKIAQGWQCPRCGSIYAIWVSECPRCVNSNVTFKSLSSNTYDQKNR